MKIHLLSKADISNISAGHTFNIGYCKNEAESLRKKTPDGMLADVSPTILSILGIQAPDEMTGKSLLTL